MKFNLSFETGKKKSNPGVTYSNTQVPELWGGKYFYKYTDSNDQQNDDALMWMYNNLPEVQAPINYIIDSLSAIPYDHYELKGDEWEKVENSGYINKLKAPNQYQTENDFIKMFFLNRIALGTGYINTLQPVGLGVDKARLFVLPTQNTEPVTTESIKSDARFNEIVGYKTKLGQQEIVIQAEDVYVQRETSLIENNYFYARSRLMSAIMTSDSLRYNYEARIKMLQDRGAVGILSPSGEQTIGPKDAELMREAFYKNTGVTGDKFPFLIGSREMNFTSTSMNADELRLNENKLQDFQTVCSVLGFDSSLLENSRSTYNNKILAKRNFYEDVAIPYYENYLQLLANVFQFDDNNKFIADYSDIPALQDDYEKKVNANSKAWNDGIITEKEYREQIGFEGGEEKTINEGVEEETEM